MVSPFRGSGPFRGRGPFLGRGPWAGKAPWGFNLGGVAWTPATLFAAGEQGAWYDPSDLTTLFQDSAGTTPVTAVEQPVGLMLDKSRGLVLGSELFTTFDIIGLWTDIGGGSWSITNAASQTDLKTVTLGVTGRTYLVSVTIVSVSGSVFVYPLNISPSGPYTTPGTYTFRAQANSGGVANQLWIRATTGTSAVVSSISVRELPGNHAFNTNATTVRPVLSARYNLLTYSEQFDNAAWTDVNVVASGARITANAVTGAAYAEFAFLSAPAVSLRVSYIFPPTSGRHRYVWIADRGVPGIASATFDLDAVSVIGANAAATPSISTLSDGSVQCSVTYTRATVGTSSPQFALAGASHTSDRPSLTWAGGEFLDAKADFRVANESATIPYQRVVTATDYDADPTKFPYYVRFDGSDDWLQTASIDFSGTDKMSVFAGVRAFSVGAQVVAELSASSSANAGSFTLGAGSWVSGGNRIGGALAGTTALGYDSPASFPVPISAVVANAYDIAGTTALTEAGLRINGAVQSPLNPGGAGSAGTGNFGAYPLYIGRRGGSGGSLSFNGRLYSLTVLGRAATAEEIASAESYAAAKTGVVLS